MEGGGLDAGINIPIGQEPMEASFVLTKFDPDVLSLWGIAADRGVGLPISPGGFCSKVTSGSENDVARPSCLSLVWPQLPFLD